LYYTYAILDDGSFSLSDQVVELYWDSTYAIAVALLEHHPQRGPEDVGLDEMAQLIENLPGFQDDPALATEQILLDIQTVWYEEALNL
jgi:FeS assembly protein IscX